MNIFMKQKQTHSHREQSCGCQGREGVGERCIRSLGISRCKLSYTGWINNKVPLCSTRKYIQYPVANHNGKKYERICMCITESLCWVGQTPLSMGILQARILEWVAMPSSRGYSQPRNWTQVSHIEGRCFTSWATREAPLLYSRNQNSIVN